MVLTYLSIEHQSVNPKAYPHLDHVPCSHSLLTGCGSAVVAYAVLRWGFGLDLAAVPALDFVLELALSIGCWW